MRTHVRLACYFVLTLISTSVLFVPTPSLAQPLNEFPEIWSPDPAAYDMYQLKFTFLGSQKKTISTLAVVGPGRPFDLGAFGPWQVGYRYSNDSFIGETLVVPGPEWQLFMDAINMDPVLQDTARIPDPNCSLMIQTDLMGPRCWEHLATVAETDLLFQLLFDSVFDPVQKDSITRFRRQMAGVRR